MLNSYIIKKNSKTVAQSSSIRWVLLALLFLFILLAIGGVIGIALIPLYLPNRSVAPSVTSQSVDVQFNFELDEGIDLPDGTLDAATRARLEDHIETTLNSDASSSLGKVTVEVLSATVVTKGARKRRTRREPKLFGTLSDFASAPIGTRFIIAVVRVFVTVIVTPTTTTIITQTVSTLIEDNPFPFTEDCTDTAGYIDSNTGHTCDTYANYGFCENESIVNAAAINATAAVANCCVCGKT